MKTEHFNELTEVETETLAILAEECCEVGQAVTKILRHGMASKHPFSGEGNYMNLAKEIGDVLGALKLMERLWPNIMKDAKNRLSEKEFRAVYFHHVDRL